MLLGKNFDDIDAATIRSLIDEGATESAHLEFKRDPYGKSDNDKKEFLKDISAFANALGGHLIIGVDEKDGAASRLTPMASEETDEERQRLENMARSGIEPDIIGLRMKPIDVGTGSVILVQVPRSHNPPHRVIFRNSNRYYARNSAGVHELSLDELRMLFGERRSIEERAAAFVRERFLRIQANDGALPMPVSDGALVMHLIPLPDFGADRRIEIATLREHGESFAPIFRLGFSSRINLDGINFHYREGPNCYAYTQIFRNGSVEATTTGAIREQNRQRYIYPQMVAGELVKALNSFMAGLRALEASPPVLLQLSFMGMTGVRMGANPAPPHFYQGSPYERDVLHLPSSLITEYRDDGTYQSVIAEQMDVLWNVYGLERCNLFDDAGNWVAN